MLDISKNICSLREFKRNTGDFISQMQGTGHAVVLTINGKAELVVQDAVSYQKLLDREGIQRGLAERAAGRTRSLEAFEVEFRAKRGLPRSTR